MRMRLAHVLFITPAAASEAINKLHAHVFKGCLLSVTLKKRLDTLSRLTHGKSSETASEDQKKPTIASPSPGSRLIVRNLPFEATEQDLRAVFLPYGPIYWIHIPKTEMSGDGEGKKDRTKGFAFVWMLSKKDAEKAIEGCNGMVVRAGTADTMVSDKQKKKSQRREEKKSKAVGESVGDQEDDLVEDKRAVERTIAVDWALSKEKWKEEKEKIEEAEGDVGMEDASSSEASAQDDDQDSEDDEDSDDERELGVHNDESEDSDDNEEDNDETEDEDMENPVKPTLPPPETGTTLFVRNVPFQATEDELRTL